MTPLIFAVAFLIACIGFAHAQDVPDILISGEIHDNPAHQLGHAAHARDLPAKAIVMEMLTPDQAALVTPALIADQAALGDALGWAASGWPDFAAYYPVFSAAPQAQYFGAAVPAAQARAAFEAGIVDSFGPQAAAYGLTTALPASEQAEREAMQMAAHCDALPAELLPRFVDIQRLRDATLARAAIAAFDATGGPVLVVTGNGHARKDGGVPVYLERVRPGLRVIAAAQFEEGMAHEGEFETFTLAPPVQREDPCAAFAHK